MQNNFEWLIQEKLKKKSGNLDQAIDDLLKLWLEGGINRQATETFFRFLLLSGYELTLASKIGYLLEQNMDPPWHFLFFLCLKNNIKMDDKTVDRILNQLNEDEIYRLVSYESFSAIHPKLKKVQENILERDFQKKIKKKKLTLSKLSLLKNERLLEEEKKLFDRLLIEYENDKEILKAFEDFKKRYADHLFSKPSKKKHLEFNLKKLFAPEKREVSDYEKKMLSFASKNPSLKKIIAVSLSLSNLYEAAIQILENMDRNQDEDHWLYLDLLFRAGKHIICLEYAQKLEKEYNNEPTKMMNCIYYQALCLNALGQNSMAIALLDTILDYDSDFKIAKELYREWSQN